MQIVKAGDLTLEPQVAAHADAMFVVLSDPALYEYENQAPLSAQGLRERFLALEARQSRDGSQQWLNWVIKLPTSELIGYVQATIYADRSTAIAYELHSAYWGRGLASLAVSAVMSHLADKYRIRNFFAVLKKENQRSMRLLQRLGFTMGSPAQHLAQEVERDEHLMLHAMAASDTAAASNPNPIRS
jgi:RimJ/RimL family protein N-acetyltransferase